MPYVDQATREALDAAYPIMTAGHLNYLITKLLIEYADSKGLCYQTLNDIMGALEGAKMEMYRRVAAGYEDKAILRNGDVYPQDLLDLVKGEVK